MNEPYNLTMNPTTENYDLRPVWQALLALHKDFDAFCVHHGLTYYVAYGTLLGAIRHGGFVPWDDDFDVMMPRPDYERLMLLRGLLPGHMKWVSIETDPNHKLLFAKIVETRKDVVERVSRQSNLALRQGLFIDVFPVDGMPSNQVSLFLWRIGRAIRRRVCAKSALQTWFATYTYNSSKYVGVANNENSNPARYRYLRSMLGTPQRVKFEDVMVNVPSDPAAVLKVDFGNWRELPPVGKRIPSHQIL